MPAYLMLGTGFMIGTIFMGASILLHPNGNSYEVLACIDHGNSMEYCKTLFNGV